MAPANSRVLITGPPGSGKEVVARMLHARSRRAQEAFVVLNCATMEPGRMEMELFGAEAGDGGDGPDRKVGTFERAHNGTLLLDEVADMPLETQGKIVRVLQEQTFERVGGGTPVQVDVRVVAASSQGPGRGDGRRHLPARTCSTGSASFPSRCRRYANGARTSRRWPPISWIGRRIPRARRRAISETTPWPALQAYAWPGNVRELRNVVERLLIMAPGEPGEPLRADSLLAEIGAIAPAALQPDKGGEIMGFASARGA